MAFQYETTIKLYDTDAAGLLFFGHQLRIVHDAYQAFMEASGFNFGEIFRQGEILVPIVHAEADYLEPLAVGDVLTIMMSATRISEHSFTLNYDLKRTDLTSVGRVQTVHVTVDRASGEKTVLPALLREALQKIAG
jgi:1,4-dihydroxy-2-naphthoyl-CoA hydrolase